MKQEEINEEMMNIAMELAKKGIDLEKLFKDLEPIFDICKQVFELGIKNYKFLLEANKDK